MLPRREPAAGLGLTMLSLATLVVRNGERSQSLRYSHAIADASVQQYLVLLGGGANGPWSNVRREDACSWDGSSWTLHLPGASPMSSARSKAHGILDPASSQLLAFAGGCGMTYTNDLWSFELPVYWRTNSYGAGCQGFNGQTLALRVATGSAGVLGQSLRLELANMPATLFPPYGVLGIDETILNSLPLPLDLAFLGLPGCTALLSANQSVPRSFPNAQGVSTWTLPLPNLPFLLGTEILLQGLNFEPFGFSRWASVSNGLTVRLGNR